MHLCNGKFSKSCLSENGQIIAASGSRQKLPLLVGLELHPRQLCWPQAQTIPRVIFSLQPNIQVDLRSPEISETSRTTFTVEFTTSLISQSLENIDPQNEKLRFGNGRRKKRRAEEIRGKTWGTWCEQRPEEERNEKGKPVNRTRSWEELMNIRERQVRIERFLPRQH